MTAAIRNAVGSLDSTLPVFAIWTMEEGLRRIMAQARFNTLLMSLLGAPAWCSRRSASTA